MPSAGSARAANAATPDDCGELNAPPIDAATSHGSAASAAVTSTPTADRSRSVPPPGAAIPTSATIAANISPVGVSPASAIQNTTAAHPGQPSGSWRSRMTAAATHGRLPYPTSRLQCPCSSRSATYGFQIARVVATSSPGSPASGSVSRASRAAPHPAHTSPASSRAFTTRPPSRTVEVTAIRKSCGTARGAAPPSPSAASDR